MSSLNEELDFKKLVTYYEKNKHLPWEEWLKVKKIFARPGKQGLVGLMCGKEDESIIYVFKISQSINYLVQHELSVMTSINEIADFCPHFCRSIGGITCQVDPENVKKGILLNQIVNTR